MAIRDHIANENALICPVCEKRLPKDYKLFAIIDGDRAIDVGVCPDCDWRSFDLDAWMHAYLERVKR